MKKLQKSAIDLIDKCKNQKLKIGTAESCTGGLISSTITSVSGSSDVYELGYVTYSNQSKIDLLKVNSKDIVAYGAVSREVCSQMSSNLISLHPDIDISIAVSGIAGPKSDDTQKEVGLVYIAVSFGKKMVCKEYKFGEIGRDNVRLNTSIEAFQIAYDLVNQL
tara:strand:- start:223 stop:714 length:492 start_codon:yes stop_codon:yes gene_type:complete